MCMRIGTGHRYIVHEMKAMKVEGASAKYMYVTIIHQSMAR